MENHVKNVFLSFVVLVSISACGGESATITDTTGSFLEQVMQALCERAAACGFQEEADVQDCVDFVVNEACRTDGRCSERVTLDRSDLDDCIDAYETFSCAGLDAGDVPSECLTINESFPAASLRLAPLR
jgi:hypothetical protein